MITRFAPSPTGPLHLGHAYSAILAHDMARAAGGAFLLRIEDIDQSRARSNWETQIYDDLEWLGLSWEHPVMRQSERQSAYDAALDELWSRGLLYPCSCNRRDIMEAATAPQEGEPLLGPDGIVYPGTCRHVPDVGTKRPNDQSLRLNMGLLAGAVVFEETGAGAEGQTGKIVCGDLADSAGDVVLARRDMGTSYHLSVVIDDADQKVTDVVRGQDLFEATAIHVGLQGALGLPTPRYFHHKLIRDETGRRLAKRDDARAIAAYRDQGKTPADIREMVGL